MNYNIKIYIHVPEIKTCKYERVNYYFDMILTVHRR